MFPVTFCGGSDLLWPRRPIPGPTTSTTACVSGPSRRSPTITTRGFRARRRSDGERRIANLRPAAGRTQLLEIISGAIVDMENEGPPGPRPACDAVSNAGWGSPIPGSSAQRTGRAPKPAILFFLISRLANPQSRSYPPCLPGALLFASEDVPAARLISIFRARSNLGWMKSPMGRRLSSRLAMIQAARQTRFAIAVRRSAASAVSPALREPAGWPL